MKFIFLFNSAIAQKADQPIKLSLYYTMNSELDKIMIFKILNETSDTVTFDNENRDIWDEKEKSVIQIGFPDYNLRMAYICNTIEPKEEILDTIVINPDWNLNELLEISMFFYRLEQSEIAKCATSGFIKPEIMLEYPFIEMNTQFKLDTRNKWLNLNAREVKTD